MSDATGSINLDGKVAVLTGVSRPGQVGEVVARVLAERGASVVLIDRTGVEAEMRGQIDKEQYKSFRPFHIINTHDDRSH